MKVAIHQAVWTLTADEKDMREAEDAMLGPYENHISQIDWEPMDEDEERPDQVDRIIRAYSNKARIKLFKVAGYLGDKGIVAVHFGCGTKADEDGVPTIRTYAYGSLDSAGSAQQFLSISRTEVARDLAERINKAVTLLSGR